MSANIVKKSAANYNYIMKVTMPIVFSFLLMLCMSCTEEPPKIKRMPYYDGCYHWEFYDETICDFYFLVKNQPEDIRELHDFLQRAADDFLTDEILSQCKEALFKKNPGKSEKTIEIRFYRTSGELPWSIDEVEGQWYYHPEISEGNPRDWIDWFRYDGESGELLTYKVWKRKKNIFWHREDYEQIFEELSNY